MDRAQCGGRRFDAAEFEKLAEGERATLKPLLRCATCGAKAVFRRRSRDGRAANFAADHTTGCDEDSRREDATGGGDLAEAPAIWNEGDELVLRRDSFSPPHHVVGVPGSEPGRRGLTHVSGAGDRQTHQRSIGLARLLLRLRTEPELSRSDRVLVLHDGSRSTIAEACAPASRFQRREGRQQILWGLISEASMSGKNLWLNTGARDSLRPAVLVRARHVDEVLEAAGVTAPDHLKGRWFIVEGAFSTTVTGTPYCTLEETAALFIAKP